MLMELDIFSSGKEYISASRAAQKSGYASDYIGQLCRSGKISGSLVGRTWYVDYAELVEYKSRLRLRNRGSAIRDESGKTRKLGKEKGSNRKEINLLDTEVFPVGNLPSAP